LRVSRQFPPSTCSGQAWRPILAPRFCESALRRIDARRGGRGDLHPQKVQLNRQGARIQLKLNRQERQAPQEKQDLSRR